MLKENENEKIELNSLIKKYSVEDLGAFEKGKITDKILKRYNELSKAEIGTIITGVILVQPEPNGQLPIPTFEKDEYIEE
jgi:2,4-dienoyl-CoA reductase-like NADH-dependent reductase (Old Yellow Enzyme family)